MRINSLKNQIIRNYKTITRLTCGTANQAKSDISAWTVHYKDNSVKGYINSLGSIERNNALVSINERSELKFVNKPLFTPRRWILKRINKMLESAISNFNNKDIVEKKILKQSSYTKNSIASLHKLNTKV